MNLQALLELRAHKALSAKDLLTRAEGQNRPMSVEEVALFDKLKEEIDSLDRQIQAAQDHAKRKEQMDLIGNRVTQPLGRVTQPDQPVNVNPREKTRIPAAASRTRPLKAFNGKKANERAYRSGMWARAAIFRDERAVHWCVTNGVGVDIRNALGGNQNSQGGFLVPDEFNEAIIVLRELYGVFRKNCFVQPMGRDTMVVPRRVTGITIGPIGENPTSGATESTPNWNQVRLTAKKAGGLVRMSTEIAEDAVIDLADYLADEFAYAFALFEDQCGFIGDGSSTYLGINGLGNILTTAGGLAGAVAAASGHDTFAEIDQTDLALLMGKLPEYARMNAKFYCSAVAAELVFGRIVASAGGNTVQSLQGKWERNYLGYPVVVSQVLATATTALNGLPMIYFGDLSKASTLGDRRDVRVFPSEHRYMELDQVGVLGTTRFDVVNHDLGSTTATGPIVALCGTT